MALHKILCPIDFSAGSRQAVQLAIRLAAADHAEIVLLHSWYIPPAAGANHVFPANLVQQIADDAKRALDEAAADATRLGAERLTTRLLTGLPWDRIVAELEDPAFDLVVMGTRGRTGLSRVLLGSIAENVVRHAPCPVLTLHSDLELRPFEHVLCPVDLSEHSRPAIELATSLIRPGGRLTLLHVVEAPITWTGELKAAEMLRDLQRKSAAELEEWAVQLRAKLPASIPVVTRTELGYAGAQILAAMEHERYDLVVTGSHGRTGIRRALLGSVAEKIVRHANCPVAVARQR